MTATIAVPQQVPQTADEACHEPDEQIAKLEQSAQATEEALRATEEALVPLQARRTALLVEEGDLEALATEATGVAFDIDSAERKATFLRDRAASLQGRLEAAKQEREQVWLRADRPPFDVELGRLHRDAELVNARFRGVALEEWEAVPPERRRWVRDPASASPMVPGELRMRPSDLARIVWPQPSGSQLMAHLAEHEELKARAKELEPRARRHGVRIEYPGPLTALEATIQVVDELRRAAAPRGPGITTPPEVQRG